MTSQNRNVYLELGIAIGLGRPFVLVKDKDADVPPLAKGLDYHSIDSYLELRYELGGKLKPFMASVSQNRLPDSPLTGMRPSVFIAHGDIDEVDFCLPIAKALAEHKLTPVFLSDPMGNLSKYLQLEKIPHHIIGSTGRIKLGEVQAAIQAARLAVFRIDNTASPDSFLALGISIALNRLGLLIHRVNVSPPSDVKGLSALEFNSYSDLDRAFRTKLHPLLGRYS